MTLALLFQKITLKLSACARSPSLSCLTSVTLLLMCPSPCLIGSVMGLNEGEGRGGRGVKEGGEGMEEYYL